MDIWVVWYWSDPLSLLSMPLLLGASALMQMPSFWQVGPGVKGRGLCSVLQWRWCGAPHWCRAMRFFGSCEGSWGYNSFIGKATIRCFRRGEWALLLQCTASELIRGRNPTSSVWLFYKRRELWTLCACDLGCCLSSCLLRVRRVWSSLW